MTAVARDEGREGGSCDIMGEIRGSRGPFQRDGGDTGTDTEVSERLRGHGATRTLVTRDLKTALIKDEFPF